MIEVPVYLPAHKQTNIRRTVAAKSAIVGEPDRGSDLIVVYYEGNTIGAENMTTFADRAMIAYMRMRDRYPTIAKMAVPMYELRRIGLLYPEYGRVECYSGPAVWALGQWLDLEADALRALPTERFRAELTVASVRVAAA